MATTIGISQSWFNALVQYVEGLQEETLRAAEDAVVHLHGKVQERARRTPGWADLADEITVWSQDGQLYLGVNNEAFVSQAFALEYGDEVRPPIALFRDLSEEVRAAGARQVQSSGNFGYGVL